MPFRPRIRRILVIKNRAIGDTILLTGSLKLLRRAYPHHQIHVLVRAPAGQLLEGSPYADRIISVREPKERIERLAYWTRLIRRLRVTHYELVLNFHASFRSSLTAKFLRTQKCVANHHELKGYNWFSDVKVPGRGKVKPVIDRDLDVLRALGITATLDDAMPEVFLSAKERSEAKALFASQRLTSGPRVFLGIGGSRETKRWPASHFADLARRLAGELDATFALSTIEIDRLWMKEFKELIVGDARLDGRFHFFEDRALRETAQIISQCEAYIGNDSGLKHLAIALGLKTFTFFGPEAPNEWHPYDKTRHPYAFIDRLACRSETGQHWCSIPVCNRHGHKCMQDLIPSSVWDQINGLLRKA